MLKVFCPKGDDELKAFASEYRLASGALLDTDYLQTSTAYALIEAGKDGEEITVGGLVVRNRPPYRSLLGVPETKRNDVAVPPSVLELVGLFIHKPHRKPKVRAFVAFGCFLAILLSRQKYLLAITTKERLWKKTYQFLGARAIYEGDLQLNPLIQQYGWVFIIERRTFFRRLPLYVVQRPFAIGLSKLQNKFSKFFTKKQKENVDDRIRPTQV